MRQMRAWGKYLSGMAMTKESEFSSMRYIRGVGDNSKFEMSYGQCRKVCNFVQNVDKKFLRRYENRWLSNKNVKPSSLPLFKKSEQHT